MTSCDNGPTSQEIPDSSKYIDVARLCWLAWRRRQDSDGYSNGIKSVAVMAANSLLSRMGYDDALFANVLGSDAERLMGVGFYSFVFRCEEDTDYDGGYVVKKQYATAGLPVSELDDEIERQRSDYSEFCEYFGELPIETGFKSGTLDLGTHGCFNVVTIEQPLITHGVDLFSNCGLGILRPEPADSGLVKDLNKFIAGYNNLKDATGKSADVEGLNNVLIAGERIVIIDVDANIHEDTAIQEDSKKIRDRRIRILQEIVDNK